MTISRDTIAPFRETQDLILRQDFAGAARACAQGILRGGLTQPEMQFNLGYARWKYRASRRGAPPRVAVCGWDLSHNAAGRVKALADIHQMDTQTEIIGTLFSDWGGVLWEPVRNSDMPVHTIQVQKSAEFPDRALDLVCAHPFDVVHLSKPRMPNIVYGLLYRLIWGARIIMDIDDEELAFADATEPLPLTALGSSPDWKLLRRTNWTRAAVGCAGLFDAVTVSNVALQCRYGGDIIPHARSARQFAAVPEEIRTRRRAELGIAADDFVVVFLGTPRAHKGLVETAQALAALERTDIHFLIIGDFADQDLKEQVRATQGLNLHFLPNQPFADLPQLLSIGDGCVLLQGTDTLVSQFQFPAKLVDALAARLVTFVSATAPLRPLIDDGAVVAIDTQSLSKAVADMVADPEARRQQAQRGHDWFVRHLSTESCHTHLAQITHAPIPLPPMETLFDSPQQAEAFLQLGLFNPVVWQHKEAQGRPGSGPDIANDRKTNDR